jgi:hypothetical protein
VVARLFPALACAVAFAALATVLAASGAVEVAEAVRATTVAALTLAVAVLGSSVGWRSRVTELLLLAPATALLLVGEPDRRRLLVGVLGTAVALAGGALNLAGGEARRRQGGAAALAAAVAVASGSATAAASPASVVGVLAVAGVAALVARRGSLPTTLAVGGLAGLAALAGPLVALLVLGVGALALAFRERAEGVAWRLLPVLAAGALAAAAFGQWGLPPLPALFPHWSWLWLPVALAIVAVPRLPLAVVGALWWASTTLVGPFEPPPLRTSPVVLTASSPTAPLPAPSGGVYLVETSLAHAAALPSGTLVALVHAGDLPVPLRAGRDAAEWSHERADVRGIVAHHLPVEPVWRPISGPDGTVWSVAGRARLAPSAAGAIRVERAASLPEETVVTVLGGVPTALPPRRGSSGQWVVGTALAVALLQLLGGAWRRQVAVLPWVVLTAASLLARVPVAPVQASLDQHAADVAAAAFLAAWLPLARRWLGERRFGPAAAALLLPVALATPFLTPPLYGDEPYHLAILQALAEGSSLAEAVAAGAPPGLAPLHGPFLAVLLLPGYVLAGRVGALAELALLAAAAVALVARRAQALGLAPSRVALTVGVAVVFAPLATYASQIWPEAVGALAVAGGLVLAAGGVAARLAVVGVAALAAAVKTRLALFTFPIAAAACWPTRRKASAVLARAVLLGVAAGVALVAARIFLGHALGAPRSLATLLQLEPRRALLAAGGLLFDPAGGFAFAAPFSLLAVAGIGRLVRRGGPGERVAVLGLGLTAFALLHSVEWYGGGSPPARYLVAGLPVLWLAGGLLLQRPPAALAAAPLLLPLAGLSSWTLVTRPHLSINEGNGRFWLGQFLAERFRTDTRHLTPSFLVPSPATLLFPLALLLGVAVLWWLGRRWRAAPRHLGRLSAALWLLAMAAGAGHLALRLDRVVEIEDAQVEHRGGRVEPPAGTWSTYLYPRGWRVASGESVVIPLRLAPGSRVTLVGWLLGAARQGSTLTVAWDSQAGVSLAVAGEGEGQLELPTPQEGGRHTLEVALAAPAGGEAVLDRLVVHR